MDVVAAAPSDDPVSLRRSTLFRGAAEAVLPELPDSWFRTCVTSPPYWGLRDYAEENQIGAEPDPALYIHRLTAIFDEVRRVLRDDGTLWRNPQARREVIGQILDYAAALASWSYEDLQRQVSLALGGEGSNVLYELISRRHPDVVEAEFVDNVTRHLRRGEFLLLIIGDDIRERAEKIVDFVPEAQRPPLQSRPRGGCALPGWRQSSHRAAAGSGRRCSTETSPSLIRTPSLRKWASRRGLYL